MKRESNKQAEKNQGQPDSTLIRDTKSAEIDTLVFVGNGAIENGWVPLRKTLDSWLQSDNSVPSIVTNLRGKNSEAFHHLAILSYKFKIARGLHFVGWADFKKGNQKKESVSVTDKVGLKPVIKTFLNMRKNIADEYKKSAGSLTLRADSEIESLIGSDAHFVTTNWDQTLWNNSVYNKNIVQLHGQCDYPDSLVFPTELLVEDAAYDFSIFSKMEIAALSPSFRDDVVSTFRCSYLEPLLAAHSTAAEWLKKARRIIIWGYSLGDYDADVNALIATHARSDYENIELVVINSNASAFERGVAITGITNAIHYNPLTKVKTKLI